MEPLYVSANLSKDCLHFFALMVFGIPSLLKRKLAGVATIKGKQKCGKIYCFLTQFGRCSLGYKLKISNHKFINDHLQECRGCPFL